MKEEPLEGVIEQTSQQITNTEEAQMSMIGSEVETISGESGVLICSSGMGLSSSGMGQWISLMIFSQVEQI